MAKTKTAASTDANITIAGNAFDPSKIIALSHEQMGAIVTSHMDKLEWTQNGNMSIGNIDMQDARDASYEAAGIPLQVAAAVGKHNSTFVESVITAAGNLLNAQQTEPVPTAGGRLEKEFNFKLGDDLAVNTVVARYQAAAENADSTKQGPNRSGAIVATATFSDHCDKALAALRIQE